MTFSVLFTFTDFQLIYVHHARRPAQRDPPDGDAARSSARSPAARSARARRSRSRWCRSCSRRSCSATSGCSGAPGSRAGRTNERRDRRKPTRRCRRRRRRATASAWATSRRRRASCVTIYLPLIVFLIVLLFPFYWMAITSVKPDHELLSRTGNPFWVHRADAGALRQAAVPHRVSRVDVEHGAGLGRRHLLLARLLGVRRLRDRAAALPAAQAGRACRSSSPTWCRRRSCSSRSRRSCSSSACSTRAGR